MVKNEKYIKSGYHLTEVGIIPLEWEIQKLGNIGKGLIGLTYKPENVKNFGTLVLRSSNIQNEKLTFKDNVYVDLEIPSEILVKENDILICARNGSRDLIGKSAILTKKYEGITFGAFMCVYRSPFGEYISHLFHSPIIKKQINQYLGATINQITNGSLNSFLIPLPSKFEQSAIAKILSDTDTLSSSIDELIDKKKAIKQGVMQKLLTGKKRLPGFSGEWNITRLGDLGFCYGGLSSKTKKDFGNGNARYIPFLNIMRSPKIDINYFDTVNIFPGEIQSKALKNDLFFNGSSETPEELGMCSVLVNDIQNLYLNSFCFGFRFKDPSNTDGLFLSYFFRSNEGRKVIYSLAQGATRYNLSKTAFLKAEIKIPCIEEQLGIAQVISDMDSEIYELQKKRDKYKQIKHGMMSELLTGNIRLLGVK